MKETVYLSNKQILLERPLFVKNFREIDFCNLLAKNLLGDIKMLSKGKTVFTKKAPQNAIAEVKTVRLMQTSTGIGIIINIKSHSANGLFFYLQGETCLTKLSDPNVEKVTQTISGEAIQTP